MVICKLCSREFKNERGFRVHLARAHDVHGSHGRLSLKSAHHFFPLLKKRRRTKARKFLKQIVKENLEDEWEKGYTQALKGMVISLGMYDPLAKPFILKLRKYDKRRLQEAEKEFTMISKKPLNTEFEKGYFRAWIDYTRYLLFTNKSSKMCAEEA